MAAGGLQPTSRIDRAITFHHIWAPDISDAYYKGVTDTIFSLLLLIANPSRVIISYWFTVCFTSHAATLKPQTGGGETVVCSMGI